MKGRKLSRRESVVGLGFAMGSILGIGVFFLAPFCVTIYYSLTASMAGEYVGLRNYAQMLQNGAFQLAALNTGRFIGTAVPLIMTVGLGVALLLYRGLKGSAFFRTVFIFPLVLPVASVVLIFQVVFSGNGALNTLWESLGIPIVDWLNSPQAFTVLVLLYIWKNVGYNIILFLAALRSIPAELYEAATIDGAGGWQKLRRITLPLIVPYLFFIFVISIINCFKAFREAYILCLEHPHKSIYMLQHFMNNNFSNLNYIRLSTASILVFVIIFILVYILLKLRGRTQVQL